MARITVKDSFDEIVEDLFSRGLTDPDSEDFDEELNGKVTCTQALIDGDISSFDGKPVYADNVLIAVDMKE